MGELESALAAGSKPVQQAVLP